MRKRTYKEAAAFAGCSISTLKRWECGWCGQSALRQLVDGCGSYGFTMPGVSSKCNPDEKAWPPSKQRIAVTMLEVSDATSTD